tara:strand:+ start:250 stop:606 length:357 start_codon:yes stop_codon:yes gene_type:complete
VVRDISNITPKKKTKIKSRKTMITDQKYREQDDVENIIEGPGEGRVAYELRLNKNIKSVLTPSFNNKSEMRVPAILTRDSIKPPDIFSDNEARKSRNSIVPLNNSAAKTSNRFHVSRN